MEYRLSAQRDSWRTDKWWVLISILILSLSVTLELPGLGTYTTIIVFFLMIWRFAFPGGAEIRKQQVA